MFFLIGGIQPKTILVDKQARSCPACGHFQVFQKRVDHYLSLFFIPLFPVKKGAPFLICEKCKTVFDKHADRVNVQQKVSETRCPHCRRHIDPDFAFCPYCGNALWKIKIQDLLTPNPFTYSSHSIGKRYLFLLLQSLQAGTRLPLLLFPPLIRGTIWSMVNSPGLTCRPQ